LPKDKLLDPPDSRYLEIETAKLHGGWAAWIALPVVTRAELLAHEHHAAMRKHYEFDQQREAGEKAGSKPPKNNFLTQMRNRFFGGGENKYG
jgi:hypothetical protein